MAEADGNRTRQTEILGLVGVEDRAAHQDEDASASDPSWAKILERSAGQR
jgi:hypothetical protein